MQWKILKRALLGYLFLTFVQSIIKVRALCVANIKGHSIKLSLHRVTHDGLTHPGVKTNIDNSAGVSKQTQDLGVKEAALSGFSRWCLSRGSAWRGVTETWQGLRPRELICQEWAASLCQDHRRSRSQFVADLWGHKMGSSLIKPLVPCFRIVLLGLDNSGKTTILYRIKQSTFSQQRPTVGFNCETVGPLWLCFFFQNEFLEMRETILTNLIKRDFIIWSNLPNLQFYYFQIASQRKLFQIWDVGGQEKTR